MGFVVPRTTRVGTHTITVVLVGLKTGSTLQTSISFQVVQAKEPDCLVKSPHIVGVGDTVGMQVLISNKRPTDVFKLKIVNPAKGSAKFENTDALEIIVDKTGPVFVTGVAETERGKQVKVQCLLNDVVNDTAEFDVVSCSPAFPPTFTAVVNSFEHQGNPDSPSAKVRDQEVVFSGKVGKAEGIQIKADVTIGGVEKDKCADYLLGWTQNLLEAQGRASYPGKDQVFLSPTLPILDVRVPGARFDKLSPFGADCKAKGLFTDSPETVVQLDSPCDDKKVANLEGFTLTLKFRVWLVVVHNPTKCFKKIKHLDWTLLYKTSSVKIDEANPHKSEVTIDPASGIQVVAGSVGDGAPNPVMSGPTMNQEFPHAECRD
jgi:hypothetical protein